LGLKKNDVINLSVKTYTLEGVKVEDSKKTIPLGRGYVVNKLDKLLIGKQVGRTLSEVVDKPFGDRVQELIRLIPAKLFSRDKINPYPGLVVNIDGLIGIVKSVSPGRVMVDFNHPLAGKQLKFDVKLIKQVVGKEDQAKAIVENFLGKDFKLVLSGRNIDIKINKAVPESIKNKLVNEILEVTGLKAQISLQ